MKTKNAIFKSIRTTEDRLKWLELQEKFINQYLKKQNKNKNINIKLLGDLWIWYDRDTQEVYASVDGEKGETEIYG